MHPPPVAFRSAGTKGRAPFDYSICVQHDEPRAYSTPVLDLIVSIC